MASEKIRFIKNTFPELKIESVNMNSQGWDNNILIINDAIVFRFPKNKAIADRVKSEAVLLRQLRQQKPMLQIPDYRLLSDGNDDITCVYYDYITGASFKDGPASDHNAALLGDFLTKLHHLDPDHSQLETYHTYGYWHELYESVVKEVFPYLGSSEQCKISDVFSHFLNDIPSLTFPQTIIHGDLTTSNILCDNGKVNGIIDFTDAQIGDPAFDFAGFYWHFGPDFTKKVLYFYDGIESKDAIYHRAKAFYGAQPAFHEWLHAVRNESGADWNAALSRFTKLMSYN
ncbi:phosphotransferase family protein [Lentibacillus salicampi]|uniref:phosphotransferase family protein n=1 Tax=Lentibacillus salicampi TaxID=175306 RepID=UPI001430C214|nr:aminoglycoside phosphotransferase family protein [Lentibacillus salicampi]